ncbi:hypothetical protein ACHAQA_001568 [Verticillium albo-atrum]
MATQSSQLIVGGEPFLMLAAELHNSTWSRASHMARLWDDMKARHINTLLGAVSWESIEPIEGQFQYHKIDQIIRDARRYGFKLVVLWFGAYKNAQSSYAPQWVRQDPKRFPRVQIQGPDGKLRVVEVLQPTCLATQDADAKAFATLMGHLQEFDGQENTVIMVQVENEIGIMGDSRDRSPEADQLNRGHVPQNLIQHLQASWEDLHPCFHSKFPQFPRSGAGPFTWSEAFGDNEWADDAFMAYWFSGFVHHVAAAGRKRYQIPLYVNVALCSEDRSWDDFSQIPDGVPTGDRPGFFPSGGPVGHNLDIYTFKAPEIELYAPDIYLQDYEKVASCFAWRGMPLFVPEQRRDAYGVRRIWAALGNHMTIGCSPFGVDTLPLGECPLPLHYGILSKLSPYILEAQTNRPEDLFGFFFDEVAENVTERTWVKEIGGYRLTVERALVFGRPSSGAGMS